MLSMVPTAAALVCVFYVTMPAVYCSDTVTVHLRTAFTLRCHALSAHDLGASAFASGHAAPLGPAAAALPVYCKLTG